MLIRSSDSVNQFQSHSIQKKQWDKDEKDGDDDDDDF